MTNTRRITRRRALSLAAASTTLPLVHIRTAGAAGKLSLALWDHWVPTGNVAMKKLVDAWAEKNKVEVQLDFLTSIGNKINITMAAESQAKAGHDVFAFDSWTVQQFGDSLTPMDDVMRRLIAKYGKLGHAYEYLGVSQGHWLAVPVGWGSAPLTPCARISLLKKFCNIDVQQWFPAHPSTSGASKDWTYDTQMKIAEASAKNGYPMGFGCGSGSTDANQTWGATFGAFGADLVDAKGNIVIESDNVRMAMEYCERMTKFMPPDAVSWDDASNNRALISGKATFIWNPPSAWAVAVRDNRPVGEDCWTFPNPTGLKGRMMPHRPYFWGVWKFAQNKGAAAEIIEWLSQREQVEALASAVSGYDIPPFDSMTDLKIWSDVEPPKGTLYNYPVRPWHNAEYYVPGSSAPPEIATQIWSRYIYPGMVARLMSGKTIKESIDWAKEELEGFR